MPWLVGCLALVFPRVALFCVWLFGGDYLGRAYEHAVWPVLGFFFMPLTTLVFAYGMNSLGAPNEMAPLGWVLVGLAAAADVGLIGSGRRSARRQREERD